MNKIMEAVRKVFSLINPAIALTMLSVLALVVLMPSVAMAADDPALPSWFGSVMAFLQGIPYVGPVMAQVLPWLGAIAALLTGFSTFVKGALGIPMVLAKWAGAQGMADSIQALLDKMKPYLDYFSMYNVQKK